MFDRINEIISLAKYFQFATVIAETLCLVFSHVITKYCCFSIKPYLNRFKKLVLEFRVCKGFFFWEMFEVLGFGEVLGFENSLSRRPCRY